MRLYFTMEKWHRLGNFIRIFPLYYGFEQSWMFGGSKIPPTSFKTAYVTKVSYDTYVFLGVFSLFSSFLYMEIGWGRLVINVKSILKTRQSFTAIPRGCKLDKNVSVKTLRMGGKQQFPDRFLFELRYRSDLVNHIL